MNFTEWWAEMEAINPPNHFTEREKAIAKSAWRDALLGAQERAARTAELKLDAFFNALNR